MNNKTSELIQEEIKKGKKVIEVVDEHLKKIEERNDALNVFLTVTGDEARQRAEEIDKLIAAQPEIIDNMPLLGIPVAYKDIYMTKGIRTTAGSNVLRDYVAQYSATVVDKIEAAGAISLGKLNCDAWAHGSSGENSDFGPTKNPVNPEYVPGGSSSGSAAAVAAGMAALTMGTDTGGSIRLPANFCGVVGFKPTYGRVSRYGIVSMASSLDSVGHFAHNVEDAAKMLAVTSGVDRHDANTANSKEFYITGLKEKGLKGVRVGVPREYLSPIKNGEVKGDFEKTVRRLEEAGVAIVEVSLPHTDQATAVYYILQPSEVSSNLARFDGIRYGNTRANFGAEAIRRIMIGTYTLSAGYYDAYYKTALRVRTLIKEDFDRVFEKVDVLVTPVSPTPPFKLGEKMNDPLEMYLSDILTVPVNLAGLPAIALPTGKTEDGLPLGIQVIGKRFAEDEIFPISYQIEQILK